MTILFLDIATVPDFELGARLYDLQDLSDKDISRVMFTKAREKNGNTEEVDRNQLQIAAISVLLQSDNNLSLKSSAELHADDLHHLQFLSTLIDQNCHEIVTWNSQKILPVLNYRSLHHGVRGPLTVARSSTKDLMSELSLTTTAAPVSQHEFSVLAGFPGNKEMPDNQVLSAFLDGNSELIRLNLEINVMNTFLIFQRWQLADGKIEQVEYERNLQLIYDYMLQNDQTHLNNFADSMKKT